MSFGALMMGHINRGWLSGNMSLGLLNFSFPINSEVPPIWFSRLVFSRLRCSFTITMLTTNCSPLPLSSSITGLLLDDLFSARECFSLNFGKFFYCPFVPLLCFLLFIELCWSCLFGEKMDTSMSIFWAFQSPYSLMLFFWGGNGRIDVQI